MSPNKASRSLNLEGTDPRLPLHARLKEAMLHRIRLGEWSSNVALPSEFSLAEEFGVSLGTLRRVLTELADDGYLERQQGRGTYVRRASFDNSLFRFFRMQGGDGQVPNSRILQRNLEKAPTEVSEALGLTAGDEVLHLLRLRSWKPQNKEPFLVEDIWLPMPLFKPLADRRLEDFGPLLYPLYEELIGVIVGSATEQLSVEQATPGVAALLDCALIDPLIRIDRIARTHAQEPVEYRRSFGLAKSFQYRAEIK